MNDIKVKTFLEALKIIHSDARKAKKYLSDKRLTIAEKKILQCWFDLKNCEHQKILDNLKSVVTEGELVEAQKCLILGLTYNNMGEPERGFCASRGSGLLFRKISPLSTSVYLCL